MILDESPNENRETCFKYLNFAELFILARNDDRHLVRLVLLFCWNHQSGMLILIVWNKNPEKKLSTLKNAELCRLLTFDIQVCLKIL